MTHFELKSVKITHIWTLFRWNMNLRAISYILICHTHVCIECLGKYVHFHCLNNRDAHIQHVASSSIPKWSLNTSSIHRISVFMTELVLCLVNIRSNSTLWHQDVGFPSNFRHILAQKPHILSKNDWCFLSSQFDTKQVPYISHFDDEMNINVVKQHIFNSKPSNTGDFGHFPVIIWFSVHAPTCWYAIRTFVFNG